MMPLASIVGLSGMVLLASALACRTVCRRLTDRRARAAVLIGMAALVLAPFGGLSVAGYLRGVIGDLSITTMALLLGVSVAGLGARPWLAAREHTALAAAALIAGAGLYPLALGAGAIDPYAWGYGSYGLAGVLLAGGLLAWYARMYGLLALLLVAIGAYLARLLESDNLWDYLIDPLLVGYAGAYWLGRAAAALRRSRPVVR